jgi:hypothetical protein
LGFEVCYVGLQGDGWLWDILHVVLGCVHVIYIAGWVAMAVPYEVARFSTVKARSFGAQLTQDFFLRLCDSCVGVCIVAEVLMLVVGCPGVRQVHWDLDIVICRSCGVGGVVDRSLLLLLLWPLLLVLLRASSPCLQSELVLILSEGIVERPWIQESLSSPDKLNHLFAFRDVDSFFFVFIVGHREWASYDLI